MGRYVFGMGDAIPADTAVARALLGGKGAGLFEMRRLGIGVPPAFVITTEAFARWRSSGSIAFLDEELAEQLGELGRELGRTFGGRERPLVVSVRSGAAASMPGMMDTILNLGLDDASVAGLADMVSPDRASRAYDRLRTTYAEIVGASLPPDPFDQLRGAIAAVFSSWDSARARTYRTRAAISDDLGTAVTVQAMVFGTAPGFSGTGVLFTRHPSTGEPEPMGDWLQDAQGEDVVAGGHQTEPLSVLAAARPDLWADLRRVAATLEGHVQDMCDIEFTVEAGVLWALQYRRGKRSPLAAVRIATDLADDPAMSFSRRDAVARIAPETIAALLAERDASTAAEPLATGLGASPGVASGKACFSVNAALDAADQGVAVILVRPETSPDDIPGMDAAEGILTATGGLVSHAAIVAREWCKPAVVGTTALSFDGATVRIAGQILCEGDELTIDGTSGHIFRGQVTATAAALPRCAERLIGWAGEIAGRSGGDPIALLSDAHSRLAPRSKENA